MRRGSCFHRNFLTSLEGARQIGSAWFNKNWAFSFNLDAKRELHGGKTAGDKNLAVRLRHDDINRPVRVRIETVEHGLPAHRRRGALRQHGSGTQEQRSFSCCSHGVTSAGSSTALLSFSTEAASEALWALAAS